MQDENLTNGDEEALIPQNTEEEIELDFEVEDEIDWKAEAEKKDKAYNDQKTRAEIAEKKLKTSSINKPQAEQKADGLTYLDMIAITKSNIEMDDIEAVTKFAKMEGLSIQEALKSDELKAMLTVKAEKRNVAQASHSGSSRRSTATISDDTLLANASKGILPESDSDFMRLQELRMGKRG